jgi:hypothetical protein
MDGRLETEVSRLIAKEVRTTRKHFGKDVEGLDGLEGRLIPPSLLITLCCQTKRY